MARLLIVSRSMALAMRLADQHEVIEHPVDDLDALGTDLDADVLVLDVGDPIQAVTTVNELRQAGQITPVLLVSGYQPEWEQVEAQKVDGVVVVPLPITRAALLAGIAHLTAAQPLGTDSDPAEPVDDEVAPDVPVSLDSDDDPDGGAEDPDADSVEPDGPTAVPDTTALSTAAPDAEPQHEVVPEDAATPSPDTADDGAEPAEQPAASSPAAPPLVTSPLAASATTQPVPGSSGAPKGTASVPRHPRPSAPGRAAPPWGTPGDQSQHGLSGQDNGRPAVPPAQPGSPEAPPLTPPWNETVRVGQRPFVQPGRPGPDPRGNGGPAGTAGTDTGSQGVLGPPSRRLPLLGNRPRKLQRRPAIAETQGSGLVTDPLGPRTDPYGFSTNAPMTPPSISQSGASSALDRRLDSEAAALAGDRSGFRRSTSGIVMRPADLVQSLLDQVGDLYGVSDTAQVLADDVIERADADAAAILVPDGPIWRVSGGVGLRPLERRLILDPSHWLITEIGSAGRAVLIDDTDIIRQQLAGAPLAAWRHLLAVPVPDVRAIVVLARGQEAGPFTDRDLSAVISPVREAAALLAQAVQTRRLARALSALREADTDAPPRRRD